MIKLGLIGYPVSQSLSPKIQHAAFKACGLDGEYSLYPIAPDDKKGLKDLLGRVRSGEMAGFNVTIPHKQNVMEFLDELTPTAKIIGAVNVIYLRGDKLIGDNTDAPGFLADLKKFVNTEPSKQANKDALVLGAGGSARAVVYALANAGWQVTIASRRIEQAEQLARSFPDYREAFPRDQLLITNIFDLQPLTFDLVVNTTPLGMTPNTEVSPLSNDFVFSSSMFVYDLVYNPRETKLVRDAKAQGCHATTGLGMLIEQAALGFHLWTGHTPPRDVLYKSVDG